MTITRRQANLGLNEAKPHSNERSAKLIILKTCQALFSKELTEEEFAFWIDYLDPMPLNAVRYAFDNWNRNGEYFPKAKHIGDLLEAYKLSSKGVQRYKPCGNCDNGWIRVFVGQTVAGNPIDPKVGALIKCQCNRGDPFFEHYGKGYGIEDMRWLWKRMQQEVKAGRKINADILLNELDNKRPDGAPEWRRA